jgi:acetoin utilization deacetylase AcuC-like enzyme
VPGVGNLYYDHPACLDHDPRAYAPVHPDTLERLRAVERALAERDWLGWERRRAPLADERELELVHGEAHVRFVRELCDSGGGSIDADTYVVEPSYRAALRAAGAACAMTRALLAWEAELGFCGVRPAGHHAEPDRAMGFCLFNSVAVAAALAVQELGARRVFVLDWDVHHGNGTAEAFRRRSDVLFASIHQSGSYPGTGALADAGSGDGEGYTINLPVPAGCEEDLWLSLLEHVVVPAAVAFEPDLVLISAGFDAHRADPLAGVRLQTESFGEMGRQVRALARPRRAARWRLGGRIRAGDARRVRRGDARGSRRRRSTALGASRSAAHHARDRPGWALLAAVAGQGAFISPRLSA